MQTRHLILAAILGTASASASATIINDDYVGARYYSSWGDRIGNTTFEIHNMDVSLTGNILNVTIYTNYAGHAGLYGTGYGDLFLGSAWTPDGAAPYITDDHSNGTNWVYGLSLDGDVYSGSSLDKASSTRFDSNILGGTASLYELTGSNNDDAFLSEDLTTGTFRNGQEVVVDRASNSTIDTGTDGSWSISPIDSNDYISFSIDLTGTSLLNGSEIALHWGMTCGNDTIEGAYQIPTQVSEPAIPALMGLGLLAVIGLGRKHGRNIQSSSHLA